VITVVGESLVDVVRRPGGAVSTHPGGSPANVAVGLARLGSPVTLVTGIGDDEPGALLLRHLRDNGVETTVVDEHPTSIAEADLDESGAASYDFSVRWDLGDPPPPLAAGSVCLHIGSIAAMLEPGASAVAGMATDARDAMTVSYDPNCRPGLMGSAQETRPRVERLVAISDVVKVSDEDLGWLYPGRPYAEIAAAWLGSGPAMVVVTRGGAGSYAVVAAGVVHVPAPAVAVVDTVGAGDAFTAGLLDALRRRHLLGSAARPMLRDVAPATVAAAAEEAATVAAVTVSRRGADPPTAAEVAALR